MVNDIEIIMRDIDKLMEQELFDKSYEKYRLVDSNLNRLNYIQFGMKENEKEALAEFYSSYAYFLFSFGEYDQFFKMYIKAQKCGYSSEKRRKFLYETFVEPNIKKFKENYDVNIKKIKEKLPIEEIMEFNELPYWLITTGKENEYYLYEKETDLIGRKISFEIDRRLVDIEITEISPNYLIMEGNSWSEIWNYIYEIVKENKKVYLITRDIEMFMSYLQGHTIEKSLIDNLVIFKNIDDFEKYFMNINNYLPRGFIGRDEEKVEYEEVIEKVHKHRLTKDGRQGDNILLSICIPSYNRGKRAYENVVHTLNSEFDEEIEIVVSNNGSIDANKGYYRKISELEDSRVVYFEFEKNNILPFNINKISEIASGKYLLYISDEDLVNLNELSKLINILRSEGQTFSVVRTRTDGQGHVPFYGIAKAGIDALNKFMLTSNYLSGLIYNRDQIKRHELMKYTLKNIDKNIAHEYYTHVIWEMILCQYGPVLGLDLVLINEGIPETGDNKIDDGNIIIPSYATLESRIEQHKSFFDVIGDLEISINDPDIHRNLYKKLCYKTLHLVGLSIRVFYKKLDKDCYEILEEAYNECIKYLNILHEERNIQDEYKYDIDVEEIKENKHQLQLTF